MSDRTGYELKEKLHEGRNTLVHRAIRKSDGMPVVLKMLKDGNLAPEARARFKREFEMTASLNTSADADERIAGVIGAFAFEDLNTLPVIVLEDFGGVSLDLHRKVWMLEDFFKLTLQV